MNKVFLVGRLTKDPELRHTSKGNVPVCTFTLAVDRKYKAENGPQADFLPIVAWRNTAEFCSKYFGKGRKVIVFGRIETRSWDDNDGTKHYVTEIIADDVDFADSKKNENASAPPPEPPPESSQRTQGSKPAGSSKPASPPPQADERMPWEME